MSEKNLCLEVKNLSAQYTSAGRVIHAVNGVSFTLEQGKTLALVGETGAGKTTIAKSILQILPYPQGSITAGEIMYEGKDLIKLTDKEKQQIRGAKISMIFQDPMTALNPVITVGEQIAEVIRKHKKLDKKTSMQEAADMLEMVGIPGRRIKEYPHQFSGGMKQRVVIAMALACQPDLLLADEPTTALDVTIQAQILDIIADLRKKLNTSMILITHDLGVVAGVADSVAVVYAGEIIEYADKMSLYLNPSHPYTQGLFGALPDISVNTRRLANIKGMPPDPANLPKGCCFSPRCNFATEKCANSKPPQVEIEPGHYCCCWRAAGEEDTAGAESCAQGGE